MNLDNLDSLDVLHRLFECLAPIVFRPVDILLKTLLQAPTHIVRISISCTLNDFQKKDLNACISTCMHLNLLMGYIR